MTKVTRTITVPKPLDETFRYVADFTNSAEWDPGVDSASHSGGPDVGVGAKVDLVATFMGREVPMTYETKVYDEPGLVVLEGEGKTVSAVDTIRFTAAGAGTRIDYEAEFDVKGIIGFAEPLMKPLFEKLADKAMEGLEETLS